MKAVVGAIVVLILLPFYFYLLAFSRIRGIEEISIATSTAMLPTYDNNRCKVINLTHFVCLPNIFLIGASKCGTTSLVSYLSAHPNVHFIKRRISAASRKHHKEIHRFDRNTYEWANRKVCKHAVSHSVLIFCVFG